MSLRYMHTYEYAVCELRNDRKTLIDGELLEKLGKSFF